LSLSFLEYDLGGILVYEDLRKRGIHYQISQSLAVPGNALKGK